VKAVSAGQCASAQTSILWEVGYFSASAASMAPRSSLASGVTALANALSKN
jgi:hypothetical protein